MIPIGGMGGGGMMGGGMMEPMDAPPVVKEKHAPVWWSLLLVMVGLCVVHFLGMEIFDGVYTLILAVIVWYMVKENCGNMSKYCLLMFGVICVIQAIFGLIDLFTSVGGRKMRRVESKVLSDNSVQYTTTIEKHPFFDNTQGFTYNIKSVGLILSPVVMLLATCMCYWTYKAFPDMSDYEDAGNEAGPGNSSMFGGEGNRMGGGGGGGYGGGGGGYGGTSNTLGGSGGGSVQRPGGGGGRPAPTGPALFSGSGQRLGS